MVLGDRFPAAFRRTQILRQLVPGVVFKLNARMDDGKIKEKRFVLLKVDTDAITCVINSKLSNFVRTKDELLKCQVSMPVEGHSFMDHDSHVDCSAIRSYLMEDVIAELMLHPDWILGPITLDLRNEIAAALKYSPLIAPNVVAELCQSLDAGA